MAVTHHILVVEDDPDIQGYCNTVLESAAFAAEELLARVKVHLEVKKSHEDLLRRNYELELITRARQDMADMIVHDLSKTPVRPPISCC